MTLQLYVAPYSYKFQFLYGAIEWKMRIAIASWGGKFQFLYGAIEWNTYLIFSFCFIKRFNSSMVRLNEAINEYGNDFDKFQFLYGAIECFHSTPFSMPCNVSIPLWCDWMEHQYGMLESGKCFNSSMVRLNEPPTHFIIFHELFQFLYGAIECCNEYIKRYCGDVSIPLWCDWMRSHLSASQ